MHVLVIMVYQAAERVQVTTHIYTIIAFSRYFDCKSAPLLSYCPQDKHVQSTPALMFPVAVQETNAAHYT